MNLDDIVYLGLLFFSIAFGYYYRKIEDKITKQTLGTAVGISIVFAASGYHIIHSFVTFLVNACIILYIPKRICHIVSFVFSFLYLLFFRTTIFFGIPYPPAHTNLIQMMLTLKMVGLAFEVNSAFMTDKDLKKNDHSSNDEQIPETTNNNVQPDFADIFHYAFNYIGVLTGPYYRYQTYADYINLPFSSVADWKQATIDRLKYVPLYALLFLWGTYNWPLSYATSEEFYERSWFYRYWFIWPNFFIFRMRIYIGLVLSECVCTMAGLGAYPAFTCPKPGEGPSENFKKLKLLSSDSAVAEETTYNFDTISNINPYGAEFCTTYREAMKHWNICIQYWLAVNVYKRFPIRKYRTAATMLVSAYWHGVYLGYYVCIGTVPFVLALENVYYKLFLKDNKGWSLKLAEWIHWFVRMHYFSYQAIAFLLLDVVKIYHYYNSIYHAGLVIGIFLYILGVHMLKKRQRQLTHP